MPEIDLPTVIFALVALFVAFKLRSVLGTRNDERAPAGRACGPASAGAGAGQPRGRYERSARARASGRFAGRDRPVEGRRRRRSLERSRRDRRGGPELRRTGVPVGRPHGLRNDHSRLRRRRQRDLAQPDGAGGVRQFRRCNSRPRRGGPDDDDDRRVDRPRRHRRRPARRLDGADRASALRASSPRSPATAPAPSSTARRRRSPTISTSGPSCATCVRAIRTGCFRRPSRNAEP